jgi:3-hydroxyacyl-[acyl-carrier-protein] dehydratase
LIDIHKILKKLPHRYPFLLVDRVLELEKERRIKALKNVTINEPFFGATFRAAGDARRADARSPGADGGAAVVRVDGQEPDDDMVVYFVGIDNARFKRPVEPGDQLILEAMHRPRPRRHLQVQDPRLRRRRGGAEAELMCTMRRWLRRCAWR